LFQNKMPSSLQLTKSSEQANTFGGK